MRGSPGHQSQECSLLIRYPDFRCRLQETNSKANKPCSAAELEQGLFPEILFIIRMPPCHVFGQDLRDNKVFRLYLFTPRVSGQGHNH